jgi:hypothetical protein
MGLEKLKFWHWMIIGVLIGVGYGWVRTQFRDADEPEVRTWDRRQFSDALNQGAVVRNLVLHPMVDGQEWVTGEIYQLTNGSFSVEGRRRQQPRQWWQGLNRSRSGNATPANAAPANAAPAEAVEKPKLPDGKWVELMMLAAEPGRKAKEYKAKPGTITRNGTTATFTAAGHGYRDGDVVGISGAAQPEYNGTFTILNVSANTFDYTVTGSPATPATAAPGVTIAVQTNAREFLATLQKKFPTTPESHRDLNFRYAWWEEPKTMMAMYGAGGFVVIGVLWPTLIALLMGAGLVKRPEPQEYDLSRFKGGADPKPESKAAVTEADRNELAELNAKLEAGVADMVQGSTAPDIDHDAEQAAVVKKLETRLLDAAEVASENHPDEPKEYQGEFYPVAKPGVHKHDKPH